MSNDIDVTIDLAALDARLDRIPDAQAAIAEAFLAFCDPYVPVRTGDLKRSGHVSGKDRVEWSINYANHAYNYSSKPEWAERAKSAHLGDLAEIAKGVLCG